MHSASIFPSIMKMISNFTIFKYLFKYFQFFLYKYNSILFFHIIHATPLLITSIFFFKKLIIFIVCILNNSKNFFISSLPLYTSSIFSMLLKEDTVDIEKHDGICSLTFVEDGFSRLFLHLSIFSIIHSRSA